MSSQRLRDGTMIRWGSKSQDMADKFQPKYLGPFKILSKISSHAYKLDLPSSFKIHPVIHIRYLAREKTSEKFLKRNEGIRPPPIIVNSIQLTKLFKSAFANLERVFKPSTLYNGRVILLRKIHGSLFLAFKIFRKSFRHSRQIIL